jgi:ABC-type amino acid transport system permease subunit
MSAVSSARPRGLATILGWRRVRFTLIVSTVLGLLLSIASETPIIVWIFRAVLVGLTALLAFGLLEQWPARLPRRLARWVLQLIGIVVVIPFAACSRIG